MSSSKLALAITVTVQGAVLYALATGRLRGPQGFEGVAGVPGVQGPAGPKGDQGGLA